MPEIPKWVAGVTFVAGLGIMIGCAVPMSKETDKTTSRYRGLTAGVVIGGLLTFAGFVMFFMGGGGGAKPASPDGNATLASEKVGSNAVAQSNTPLNKVNELTHQTETQALLNEGKALNLKKHAQDAIEKTSALRAIIGMMGGKK